MFPTLMGTAPLAVPFTFPVLSVAASLPGPVGRKETRIVRNHRQRRRNPEYLARRNTGDKKSALPLVGAFCGT